MKVLKELEEDIVLKNENDSPLEVVQIENEYLRLSIVPSLGGKIIELLNKQTGTQFLKDCSCDLNELQKPLYGDEFLPPYAFGFDECFPNIASESIVINNEIKELPDHGEIWTQDCSYEVSEHEIILYAEGSILKYTFLKKIRLKNQQVIIDYHLKSKENNTFNYVWSAHPLLNISEGDEIVMDNSTDEMIIDSISYGTIESSGNIVNWPFINTFEKGICYNRVQHSSHDFATKLYIHSNDNGSASVYYPLKDESITFNFDIEKIPHIGIWLCYGGWPKNSVNKEFTIAIEPARGGYDSLQEAINNQKVFSIKPDEKQHWQMVISVKQGR